MRAPGLGCARVAGTWRASKGTGQEAFPVNIAARRPGGCGALSRGEDRRARGWLRPRRRPRGVRRGGGERGTGRQLAHGTKVAAARGLCRWSGACWVGLRGELARDVGRRGVRLGPCRPGFSRPVEGLGWAGCRLRVGPAVTGWPGWLAGLGG